MKRDLFELEPDWNDGWSADNKDPKKAATSTEIKTPQQHRLHCSREKRRGKVVTIVQPFYLEKKKLQTLLKNLKKQLGTGGTIKDNSLELQGDIAASAQEKLKQKGYAFKHKRL
jgi:translation initiation factor 1